MCVLWTKWILHYTTVSALHLFGNKKLALKYGDAWIKKSRKKRHKLLVAELCLDFAQNTTLHGLRYTIQRGLSIVEKVFWLITFLVSIGMCSYLIRNVYIKFKYSPVIVTVNEKLMPVGMVPFPSVTICPQIKCKTTVYNYTAGREKYQHAKNTSEFEMEGNYTFGGEQWMEKLEDVSMICDNGKFKDSDREFTNSSLVDHILEVSPDDTDVFFQCNWRNDFVDCGMIFKRVLTAEGVCYNMNGLSANEIFRDKIQKTYDYIKTSTPARNWTMEKGYSDDIEPDNDTATPNPYPRRGRENGATPDFVIYLLQYSGDLDSLCNSVNSGYKIYIQHPADLPQSSLYYYAALPKQVSSLAVNLNVLNTDESLKHHPANIRQCYFPEDRYLRYFRIYTANNCRMECLSNYTFRLCGCVGYYMPHDKSNRICTNKKVECIKSAQEIMANEELKKSEDLTSQACRCLPACNSVDYEAEILKTNFNMKTYLAADYLMSYNYNLELDDYEFTKVEIYFKRPRFISMRRSELYGVTDFLANCGGLLGLFLGFSFLSLVEIIYFLTLRLGFTIKRDLDQEKKNKTEKAKQ